MPECAVCKSETSLYASGVPICVECAEAQGAPPRSEAQIRAALLQQAAEATARTNAARDAFFEIMRKNPDSVPYGESGKRLFEASRELSAARKEMMTAEERLSRFTSRSEPSQYVRRSG